MKFVFSVDNEYDKTRLNVFLRCQGVSRALIRKIKFLPDGILVDGQKQNADYIVSSGQTVTINTPEEEPETTVIPQQGNLDIVYMDRCCMVVNKPYNMPAHPSFNHPTDTVANYFMGYWQEKGENKICRIINRLDRNTSGLLLIALDAHSAQQFKNAVDKTYTAIVSGKVAHSHGIIDRPIARQRESIITRRVRRDGQRAVTEYWVKKSDDNFSLMDIKLHTGRTHQIRVHFSHTGHPLEGDDLYGGSLDNISRHALHCSSLSFVSPSNGERITVSSKLPEDMQKLADKIGQCDAQVNK